MAKTAQPIDQLVGTNVRIFRTAKGLSQQALGDAIGVTFQQIQKYEKGVNRIVSGRLAKIAEILEVPVANFFQAGVGARSVPRGGSRLTAVLSDPDAVELVLAFAKIPTRRLRRRVVDLTTEISRLGNAIGTGMDIKHP